MIRLLILALLLSGCATSPTYKLVDQRNRDQSQRVLDRDACTKTDHYFHGQKVINLEYYYACMDKLGYTMEVDHAN